MWRSWRYFVAFSLMGLILVVIGLAVALFPQSITSNIIIFLGIILIILSATYSVVAIWNDSRQKHSKGKETSKSTRADTEKITKKGFSPRLSKKKVGISDTEYNSEIIEEKIREIEEKLKKKKLEPEK